MVGFVRVGDVPATSEPVPVAVAPSIVATPVPRELKPVPPCPALSGVVKPDKEVILEFAPDVARPVVGCTWSSCDAAAAVPTAAVPSANGVALPTVPGSPLGMEKLNVAAVPVPLLLIVTLLPAAPVVTVPIEMVGVAPDGPTEPVEPVAP